MKFNKISKRLAACSLAGVMMVSMLGMTAFAEGATGYKPSEDSVAVQFDKVLDMTSAVGASTPAVEFNYTVSAGTAVAATATTPEIKAGVGTPSIETVKFLVGGVTTNKATVDFSDVTFTAPGIYRYIITETASATTGIYENIKDDTKTTRVLDVYVQNVLDAQNKVSGYKITNSVLTETALTPVISKDKDGEKLTYGDGTSSKSSGFKNEYSTWSLTLDKTLDGTMADYSKEFDFTIVIKGMQDGSTVTVDDVTSKQAVNGMISITAKLGDGKSTTITGIPANASYEITEIVETKDGYTPSITTTNSEQVETSGSINGGNNKVTGEMKAANATVSYTNTKNAVTPTGVAMTVAPYILMVAVAGIFAILFLRRRNEEA